jgi:tetratricopeptide (TPR) repeat protein
MDGVIGIDFGSARCRTAVCRQGEVEVFSNRFSERALPVSIEAVEGAPLPVSVSGLKEKLGSAERLALGDRRLPPVEAAAEVLRDLAADAREFTGGRAERAVVGVPACFRERQRAALQEAAERGGFRLVRLLDESVAALLSPEALRRDQTALVYALGAGGFCASVVRVERGAVRELCHEGQPGLGGHLLTALVMAAILERLPLSAEQLSAVPAALSLLRARAEQVKLGLSKRPLVEFDVNLRELFPPDAVPAGGASLSISLWREDFERRIAGYIDTTIELTRAAVRGAGLDPARIDSVVLLGGATRTPLIERRLRGEFSGPSRHAPETAVASGLAWFGAQVPDTEWNPPEPRPEGKPAPPPAPQPAAAASESWSERFAPSFQEAQVHWLRGDHRSAIARFDRILREELPRFLGHMHHQHGRALLAAARFDDAIAALQRAAALDPRGHSVRPDLHHAFSTKSRFLYQAGRLSDARATLQQALQLDPRCPRCLAFRDQLETHFQPTRRGDSRRRKRGR